jgi:hypothetical protein
MLLDNQKLAHKVEDKKLLIIQIIQIIKIIKIIMIKLNARSFCLDIL